MKNFLKIARLTLLGVLAASLAISCSCRAQEMNVPKSTSESALSNSAKIGVGLEGLADWSSARMFADAMKTSRAWGKADQPWNNENTVKTDEFGWPLEDAGVFVIADVPDIGGTYSLSFNGKADVKPVASNAKIENLKYDAATKKSSAEVVVPDKDTQIMLAFTGTDGGVKNVRLVRPGAKGKGTFNPAFLEKLKPFSPLRFMDFLSTNNNPVKRWDERTTPQHFSQARAQGGALEYVVALANVSGKDIWVNVPDQADDDYVRRMAQLLKDGLEKDQKIYVEWSNEVWNWQFQQATRNLDAAKIEGRKADAPLAYDRSDNEGYWAMRRIAGRSAEIGAIFQEIFGDEKFARVRPVYAVQVGYEEVYKQGLAFLEHRYGRADKAIYGLAGAPYFNLNDEENKNKNITVDEIFDVLPQRIDETLESAKTLGSFATYHGLKLLAYEGGQHLQDHSDVGNSAAKIAANRDPRMGEMIERYLKEWQALGGDTFVYFTLSSGYSKWGSWGLVEDITKTSPKYEAALRVVNGAPVPLTAGKLVPGEIKAGDFAAGNRWDKKGEAQVTFEPGKWLQYVVRVPKSGAYKLTLQLSSGAAAGARVLANARDNGEIKIAAGASAAQANLQLDAGLNTIRIVGETGRFELKSLRIER